MHELAVTQSMLDLVLEEARKVGAGRIQKINLVIGNLSGIVGDSVEFYFQFLSKDTMAQGATLAFESVPTRARCRGNTSLEIVGGNELYVDSIDVE
jgi:hydrogenase nickel incorporation protein HypA/HybF